MVYFDKMFSRSTENEPFVEFRNMTIVMYKQLNTSAARSIRYVQHSFAVVKK